MPLGKKSWKLSILMLALYLESFGQELREKLRVQIFPSPLYPWFNRNLKCQACLMVITRSAKRSKSIIAWLPNEVLFSVVAHAAQSDLLSLCLTSHLMRNIARRFLYREVLIDTVKQLKLFVRGGAKRKFIPLLSLVRKFGLNQNLRLGEALIGPLTSTVTKMINLRHLLLYLAKPVQLHKLLREGIFSDLLTFRYIVQPATAFEFLSFLDKHSTIDTLTFASECHSPIDFPERPSLPSLRVYEDATDPDCCLARLKKARGLEVIVILTVSHTPRAEDILAEVSRHLPHVRVLRLRSSVAKSAGLSTGEATEIASHLRRFTALRLLEFSAIDYNTEFRLHYDRQALTLWQDVCKTISSVILNSICWEKSCGEWHCENKGITQMIKLMQTGALGPTFVFVPSRQGARVEST
ncbi:hypothetical protein R3P38DRAFT_2777225 [Favolaschia claudopus]|uniref:F-box domain-containing protein n=1 Tax=Favolaschia claudopus TaxID=2862362 RepID=A0AAW0BM89_9AGAR